MMRFVRVPYYYLPTVQVQSLYTYSYRLLLIIHDIHHGIPNDKWHHPQVKAFMYHPSFLRWVFVKSKSELIKRGVNCKITLPTHLIALKSRSLKEFVPPSEAELADDIVWLLGKWRWRYFPGGQSLSLSYLELVHQYYDYNPEQAANQRVDQVPGSHRDSDRDWYRCEGEEASQVNPRLMGDDIRRGSHGWR